MSKKTLEERLNKLETENKALLTEVERLTDIVNILTTGSQMHLRCFNETKEVIHTCSDSVLQIQRLLPDLINQVNGNTKDIITLERVVFRCE